MHVTQVYSLDSLPVRVQRPAVRPESTAESVAAEATLHMSPVCRGVGSAQSLYAVPPV